jgi:predicted transcriptional regulator
MIRADAPKPRRQTPRKSARITVSLSASQHNFLSRLASKNDVSLSWIMRRAIEEYIQNNSPGTQRVKKSADRS